MSFLSRLRNRHFFVIDLHLLLLAAYLSFVLRLERIDIAPYWAGLAAFSLVAVIVTPWVLRVSGVYSRFWRYASIDELLLLAGASTVSAVLTGATSLLITTVFSVEPSIPRSVPLIYLLLVLGTTAAPRLAVRIAGRYNGQNNRAQHPQAVAIMGAGDAGAMILREIQNSSHVNMNVVGLLDDDPDKRNVRIHGVPVLGGREDIPRVVERHNVSRLIIAMPTAPGKVIREIVAICERASVQTKIIPGIYELLDGTVSVNQLRDVDIEDLLRREPVQTDIAAVHTLLQGKRVLVTGGGGSIGSELCRQILRCKPAELVLVGHGENSIFAITRELKAQAGPGTAIRPIITDIRFRERVQHVFATVRPQVVFHAAAHKHVPLMEVNPAEAITNNVLGTRCLLAAAQALDTEQFVMISTDKAVNPTSIMGASKRVAEMMVHEAAQVTGNPYVTVRFGNVLGSRGSVVLTFKQQIARGGPVTVTDPEMQRYFMTIPEAVQLVLQAAVLGQGGETFVLDMGEPVKIVDLARDLIELSGLELGRDIDITFVGRRPGEKLFEELFVDGESHCRTEHEKIFIAGNASSLVPDDLEAAVSSLIASAQRNDGKAVHQGLRNLIPEYRPREQVAPFSAQASMTERASAADGQDGKRAVTGQDRQGPASLSAASEIA